MSRVTGQRRVVTFNYLPLLFPEGGALSRPFPEGLPVLAGQPALPPLPPLPRPRVLPRLLPFPPLDLGMASHLLSLWIHLPQGATMLPN